MVVTGGTILITDYESMQYWSFESETEGDVVSGTGNANKNSLLYV